IHAQFVASGLLADAFAASRLILFTTSTRLLPLPFHHSLRLLHLAPSFCAARANESGEQPLGQSPLEAEQQPPPPPRGGDGGSKDATAGGNRESEDAVVVTLRRGLVGRGRGERGRCRRAASGPGGEGTGRARTPPPSRTQLHHFSFPNLSWGNHRLLRCSKNPASSPPPAAPDTPSPDKEKTAHSSTDGVGVGSLPQRGPQQPWNLRTCRSATAAPCPKGLDDAADAALE
uniref:Uncharacterized protein n=1 Tax=Oryza glumipatula TaxID=40148 RepID=A0A0E0ALJ8_9ORYZ